MITEEMYEENNEDLSFNYVGNSREGRVFGNSDLENEVGLFLHDIQNYPLLNKEETNELFRRMHAGDDDARQSLINCNLRLVANIAKKYINRGLDYSDLIQEGVFGLTRAIELFDETKGFRLSTYATQWINQSISRAVVSSGRAIRIPVHVHDDCVKVLNAKAEFVALNGYEPSDEELVEHLDGKYTVEQISNLRDLFSNTYTDSLDKEIAEDLYLCDTISSSDDDDNYEAIDNDDRIGLVKNMISSLDDKSAIVLTKVFGLDGNPEMTLEAVGREYGVSRERIRQIKASALAKLNKLYAKPIKESLQGGTI